VSPARRPADLAETLAGFEFFDGIERPEIDRLAALALCHEYPKNNILAYFGDPASNVFLVVSGRVKVILTNDDAREVVVSLLGPGCVFGLTGALDGGEQPGTAITVERSTIARFSSAGFLRWMDSAPGAKDALVRELNRRVRDLHRKIGAHALLSARDRLLNTLMDIAGAEGEREPGNDRVTFTRPTHQELANRIGTSREVVSRLLAELREADILEAEEGRVIRLPLSSLVLHEE
jgi:CRP/FNR family cyclic AMP-dependent transcriptional regulator